MKKEEPTEHTEKHRKKHYPSVSFCVFCGP
jgi:hypothetical protein